jgi:hypothetical protein
MMLLHGMWGIFNKGMYGALLRAAKVSESHFSTKGIVH